MGTWCLADRIATTPSRASISEHLICPSFAAAIQISAIDTFDDLDSQFVPTTLARPMGSLFYSISAEMRGQPYFIYGIPDAPSSAAATWITTNGVSSEDTFSGLAAGIDGIGACFFIAPFSGDISPSESLRVTPTYAGGSVSELVVGTDDTNFLGFVSNDKPDRRRRRDALS